MSEWRAIRSIRGVPGGCDPRDTKLNPVFARGPIDSLTLMAGLVATNQVETGRFFDVSSGVESPPTILAIKK